MAKNTYSGYLKMIGNSTMSSGTAKMRTYTVIDIGEHQLKGVKVTPFLDNYLSMALKTGGETALEVLGNSSLKILFIGLPLTLVMGYLGMAAFTFTGFLFFYLFMTALFEKDNRLVAITIDGKRYTD